MNIIALTGNAVKDVELRYTPSGTAVGKGTIAVRRDFKDKQSGQYETDFINFTAFGKLAETMSNFIAKGDKFGVNGKLQIDVWENDEGKKQYSPNVIVNGFDFPDKKQNAQPTQQQQPQSQPQTRMHDDPFATSGPIEVNSDDLPF